MSKISDEELFNEDLQAEFCITQDCNEVKFIEMYETTPLGILAYINWLTHKLWVMDDELRTAIEENEDLGGNFNEEIEYACNPEFGR